MAPARAKALWPVRGIMVDPARLTERHEFYFDLLERMAEWGLNTLWWHFADDEGFCLKLRSHPELATPHAFTRAEMKRFCARARSLGIEVVPEVESLGHARYVTRLRRYAELADGSAHGFNAICPSHPRTLPLLEEIIREVAGLFPGRYFHAGMDEVDLGDCPRCRRRARGRAKWWIYAEHLQAIHRIVRSCGKEMIVWADHVEKDPAMLRALPGDVILAHWHYTRVRPEAVRRSLRAGFRVIGCPAMCHWGDMVMPNAANFRNMDAMTELVARLPRRRQVLGAVNTCWTLWRGLRDAYLPAMAYTGAMLKAGRGLDKGAFFRRFVREFYGLRSPKVARAIADLHDAMLTRDELSATLFDSPADMHEAVRLYQDGGFRRRVKQILQCLVTLLPLAGRAPRHSREFDAIVLATLVAAMCVGRARALTRARESYSRAKAARRRGLTVEQVAPELEKIAASLEATSRDVRALLRWVSDEWNGTRYADDVKKGLDGKWRAPDALLVRLASAVEFADRQEGAFRRGLARYRRGGPFPTGL